MARKRHKTILRREDSVVVVVDYQQRLVDVMQFGETVTDIIVRLVTGAKRLDVPVLATEQYPEKLGGTVPAVAEFLGRDIVPKMTFSCAGCKSFMKQLKTMEREQVVLVGIETHVCLLQTALDLHSHGFQVHVPEGATTSRDSNNRENALRRMQHEGVVLTNLESVLFEWMVEAGTDEFRDVRKLIV